MHTQAFLLRFIQGGKRNLGCWDSRIIKNPALATCKHPKAALSIYVSYLSDFCFQIIVL